MATEAYTTGQSLKNIVDDCEAMFNKPRLNLDPATDAEPILGALRNAPGYRWLLDIIRNLYVLYDWPFAITATTLTLPTGTRSLTIPSRYWRLAYERGVILIDPSNSSRTPLEHLNRETFFNTAYKADSSGRPCSFFLAQGNGTLWFEPNPDKTYFVEIHYYQTNDMSTLDQITDIPPFPHHDYLKLALMVEYAIHQKDSDAQGFETRRLTKWREIRGSVTADIQEGGSEQVFFGGPTPQWDD